jgi:hypothetical protein
MHLRQRILPGAQGLSGPVFVVSLVAILRADPRDLPALVQALAALWRWPLNDPQFGHTISCVEPRWVVGRVFVPIAVDAETPDLAREDYRPLPRPATSLAAYLSASLPGMRWPS